MLRSHRTRFVRTYAVAYAETCLPFLNTATILPPAPASDAIVPKGAKRISRNAFRTSRNMNPLGGVFDCGTGSNPAVSRNLAHRYPVLRSTYVVFGVEIIISS